ASVNLPILGTSSKWNHTVFVLVGSKALLLKTLIQGLARWRSSYYLSLLPSFCGVELSFCPAAMSES
ncbi:hypothetical protein, partial [Staphylococcus auricularis]|uniref:hypothetical protein n=1 Tax=Staphylococcus auricularis TaxID=29379 RepID=UPI003F7A19BE